MEEFYLYSEGQVFTRERARVRDVTTFLCARAHECAHACAHACPRACPRVCAHAREDSCAHRAGLRARMSCHDNQACARSCAIAGDARARV